MGNIDASQDAQRPDTETTPGELTNYPMVRYDARTRDPEFPSKSQRPESDLYDGDLRSEERPNPTEPEKVLLDNQVQLIFGPCHLIDLRSPSPIVRRQ